MSSKFGSRYEVRSAVKDDVASIARIYNYYVLKSGDVTTFEEDTVTNQEMTNRFLHITDTLQFPFLVAYSEEDDNKVIGYAYAGQYKTRTAYRFSVEDTIYLDPEYTGKGIGSILLNELIEALKNCGKGIMNIICVIGTMKDNPGSMKLHENFGFKVVAKYKKIGYKYGKFVDRIHMQLCLNEEEDEQRGRIGVNNSNSNSYSNSNSNSNSNSESENENEGGVAISDLANDSNDEKPVNFRTLPCRHFFLGRCVYGDKCHYVHSAQDENSKSGEVSAQAAQSAQARMISNVTLKNMKAFAHAINMKINRTIGSSGNNSHGQSHHSRGIDYYHNNNNNKNERKQICRHFTAGTCNQGALCRFLHHSDRNSASHNRNNHNHNHNHNNNRNMNSNYITNLNSDSNNNSSSISSGTRNSMLDMNSNNLHNNSSNNMNFINNQRR